MQKINPAEQLSNWLAQIISEVPEPHFTNKPSEEVFIQKLIKHSALKSSSVSATLALPGGMAGIISVLPDIAAVWRIQSQMISNIAAAHGKSSLVTREQMLWCMFRQMAVGVMKELIIQQGTQYIVKQGSDKLVRNVMGKIGHGIIRSQGTKAISKVVPLLGSISAGALTYYDTYRVGKNANELYSKEIILLPETTTPVTRR